MLVPPTLGLIIHLVTHSFGRAFFRCRSFYYKPLCHCLIFQRYAVILTIGFCKCRKSHTAISEFRGQKINTKENHKKQPLAEVPELRSAQVLLLLIQHGANGLNLLEAQHVILVEPLLNPAAEAQAISRVHRIGQQNKTFVHRFIVCTPPSFYSPIEFSPKHTVQMADI